MSSSLKSEESGTEIDKVNSRKNSEAMYDSIERVAEPLESKASSLRDPGFMSNFF